MRKRPGERVYWADLPCRQGKIFGGSRRKPKLQLCCRGWTLQPESKRSSRPFRSWSKTVLNVSFSCTTSKQGFPGQTTYVYTTRLDTAISNPKRGVLNCCATPYECACASISVRARARWPRRCVDLTRPELAAFPPVATIYTEGERTTGRKRRYTTLREPKNLASYVVLLQ